MQHHSWCYEMRKFPKNLIKASLFNWKLGILSLHILIFIKKSHPQVTIVQIEGLWLQLGPDFTIVEDFRVERLQDKKSGKILEISM